MLLRGFRGCTRLVKVERLSGGISSGSLRWFSSTTARSSSDSSPSSGTGSTAVPQPPPMTHNASLASFYDEAEVVSDEDADGVQSLPGASPSMNSSSGQSATPGDVLTSADLDQVVKEGLMSVPLMPFQEKGVRWMLRREFFGSGGIMADGLGMGKTVQMLALCAASDALLRLKHPEKSTGKKTKDTAEQGKAGSKKSRLQKRGPKESKKKNSKAADKVDTAKETEATASAPAQPVSFAVQPQQTDAHASVDPTDPFLGPRLAVVIRQMKRIPAIGNCTALVRPAKSLFDLLDDVDAKATKRRASGGTIPVDYSAELVEVKKWLEFSKAYHPAFEKQARWYIENDANHGMAPTPHGKAGGQRTQPMVRTHIHHSASHSEPLALGGTVMAAYTLAEATNGMASTVAVAVDMASPQYRTLVVVPASLMHQWASEIRKKVPGDRSVLLFHGSGKEATVAELEAQDFVVTTYETVVSQLFGGTRAGRDEFNDGGGSGLFSDLSPSRRGKKRRSKVRDRMLDTNTDEQITGVDGGPLFHVAWKRLILDEAHNVRNPYTQRWKAVEQLRAVKRWAMSATPIHNSIGDIQNLLELSGVPRIPLTTTARGPDEMDSMTQRNVAQSLAPVIIRRSTVMKRNGETKVLVELPPMHEEVVFATMSETEAKIYNNALSRTKQHLNRKEAAASTAGGNRGAQKAIHVLAMMTHMRQVCCHHWLYSASTATELMYKCDICNREAVTPLKTQCSHVFCRECLVNTFHEASISAMQQQQAAASSIGAGDVGAPALPGLADVESVPDVVRVPCPTCNTPINVDALKVHQASNKERLAMWRRKPWESSTKVKMAIDEIRRIQNEHPDDKVVLFSHFTSFLDILSLALEQEGVLFSRLDGTMKLSDRNAVISAFGSTDASVRVLLASKMASGVGLNLTMANHVIIVDPWWNPAVEEQAVHRCHRIGQLKPVHVKRFIIRDSLEQYCYEISQRKRDFGHAVLQAATEGDGSQQSVVGKRLEELVGRLGYLSDSASASHSGR